jgi:hypothetical protein
MLALNGSPDMTQIEILMAMDSNTEVAEICQDIWGNRPGG